MDTRHADLLDRLEQLYDKAPRDAARAEEHGGCVLFVREGPGWPFYARPRPDAPPPRSPHPPLPRLPRGIAAPTAALIKRFWPLLAIN
ncbi:hypothetical protein [Micromonospora craniellae]|uniref:hypothetical protein n=1 Tax=Micromonospora craniellae TaxID=2294034 RepID=UPI0026BCE6E0